MKAPWRMTRDEWDEAFRQTMPNAYGTGGDTRLGGMGRCTTVRGLAARAAVATAERDRLTMGLPDRDIGGGLLAPPRHRDVVEEALRLGYRVPRHAMPEAPELKLKRGRV